MIVRENNMHPYKNIKIDEDHSRVEEIFLPYASEQAIRKNLSLISPSNDLDLIESKQWVGEIIKRSLPEGLISTISNFAKNNMRDVLIIRGLPIDEILPSSPYCGYSPPNTLPLANSIHIGIYQLMGVEPISYQTENNGNIFRHVVPAKYNRNDKSSHGSKHTFGMHVDNPDLPLVTEEITDKSGCPEFLSLMAIRADLKVKSSLILLDDALSQLSTGTIEQLTQSEYLISRPDSFKQKQQTILPLLTFDENNVSYCRYDKENVTPLTPEAAAALVMLQAQIDASKLKYSMMYQAGDMLIIKNQRLMHCREGFTPRDDGTDRWLIRLFGMNSLERIVPTTASHIGKD